MAEESEAKEAIQMLSGYVLNGNRLNVEVGSPVCWRQVVLVFKLLYGRWNRVNVIIIIMI